MPSNPLVDIEVEIPFSEIVPNHIEPAIATLLAETRTAIDEIAKNVSAPPTYEETLGALDRATERLEVAMSVVGHLESVKSSTPLREAHNKVRPEVSAFFASIPLDERLWRVLQDFSETPEARSLSGARKRFLEKTVDDFRRHGAELDPEGKKRLEAISRELAELTNRFAQNVLDSTAGYELMIDDEARLAGLPDSARAQARESAESKGKKGWRLTLQAPSVIPVLRYLEDASIREEIYRAYNSRAAKGEFDNGPIIDRVLDLRREKAALLSYPDFADLVLEDRMAKSGSEARRFVEDLERRSRSTFEAENDALVAFRRECGGQGDLEPWDVDYYAEKQRKALYDFDEEELRPYFPVNQVLDGLFQTAERLYGVRVEPRPELPSWHSDVERYALRDRDGALLGLFHVDLYPREEKRSGAWMHGLISGVPIDGKPSPHVGLIAANLSPPIGGKPALLTHREVETLFHEFGHLLHHLLSSAEIRTLSGTNVVWDFVELPSQIMENWCWEREALDLFARHHETGEAIPEQLFRKMTRARTYRAACAMMRQLGFGTVDLALHIDYSPDRDRDVVAYSRQILQGYAPTKLPEGHSLLTSFGHLFSSAVGYAAGYYSYKWAEVLDADAFTRFRAAGVFSPEVGAAFRTAILEKGDTDEPAALYERFMGRPPSIDALLERSGLRTESS